MQHYPPRRKVDEDSRELLFTVMVASALQTTTKQAVFETAALSEHSQRSCLKTPL